MTRCKPVSITAGATSAVHGICGWQISEIGAAAAEFSLIDPGPNPPTTNKNIAGSKLAANGQVGLLGEAAIATPYGVKFTAVSGAMSCIVYAV